MMEQLQNAFKIFWQDVKAPKSLLVQAKSAFAKFLELGFPNRFKDENWKYTNLKMLDGSNLNPASLKPQEFSRQSILNSEYLNIVFYNGQLLEKFSQVDGLEIQTLAKFFDEDPSHSSFGDIEFENGIDALQEAFATSGVHIKTNKSAVIKPVICIHFINDALNNSDMICPQIYLDLAENSEVTLLEQHSDFSENKYFSNFKAKCVVGKNARLKYYKIQNLNPTAQHIDHTHFAIEASGQLETFNLSQGAALSRYDLNINLLGEGAGVQLDGIYHPFEGQHVDHQTKVDHKVANCRSSQLYKGVIRNDSRAVFNGKVFIRKNAIGTDADQLNKNLLMGDRAEVDTKPQMEIDADDVKCAHGATIGSLDPEQIFYLESRGITPEKAEQMLAQGFINEVTERISCVGIRELFQAALVQFNSKV